MRINAKSTLTHGDILEAIGIARSHGCDIHLDDYREGKHGAKQFWCGSVNGRYAANRHTYSYTRAASWAAWGYVIAELFNRDPNAHIGQYRGVDDFIAKVHGTQQIHYNRLAFGITTREGEPGQDVSFLATIGQGW